MALDSLDRGDDLEQLAFNAGSAAPSVVALISVPAPAGINPDSAALFITQGGNTFGPYPATFTANPDGTNSLSVSFSVLPVTN